MRMYDSKLIYGCYLGSTLEIWDRLKTIYPSQHYTQDLCESLDILNTLIPDGLYIDICKPDKTSEYRFHLNMLDYDFYTFTDFSTIVKDNITSYLNFLTILGVETVVPQVYSEVCCYL